MNNDNNDNDNNYYHYYYNHKGGVHFEIVHFSKCGLKYF